MFLIGAIFVAGGFESACARDILVIGTPLEPPNLDPASGAAAAVDTVVYGNIFEGLTQITQTGEVAPLLAESWDASPDRMSYIFHLRHGVHFHDGTSFDAEDVKFTIDRILAPDSTNAQKALYQPIKSVEVLDPYTVQISLSRPASELPYVLGWGDAVMVAPESVATAATQPVGTGPYKFMNWRRGDSLTLSANDDYWGAAPHIRTVEFKFIGDAAAAYSALKAGDVDAFPNYPAPENVADFERDPRFKVVVGASEGKVILAINNRKAPLNNVLVRRAISHAIDREAVIDGAMFGFGEPIGSHFTRSTPGFEDLTGKYPHDQARARALLTQAGYKEGLSLTLRAPPRPYARRAAEIIAAELGQVGVHVTVENLEWAQWLDQVFTRHDFDLTIVEHVEPMDFGIYARDDYYFGYANAAYKKLYSEYQVAIANDERSALLRRMQETLADDAVNAFLYQSARITILRNDLNGLWADMPVPATILANAYFTTDAASPARQGKSSSGGAWVGWLLLAVGAAILAYAARRLGAASLGARFGAHAATLVAASIVIFTMVQVVPGDPAAYMMGLNANPEAVAALREQLGLNGPLLSRYADWTLGLIRGDFGTSYTYEVPVGQLVAERLNVSGPLALMAMAFSIIIGIPVGVIAASRRGGAIDTALNALMQIGVALPNFWIAMLLIMVFSIQLQWFSAGGFSGWGNGALPALRDLFLPALALAAPQAAILARVMRSALLDTMNEDYVRTARAKGLTRDQAMWRHALRNAMIPVLTIIGLQFPFLLAGGIIIENVFSLPGLGRLVFQAIIQRDLIVVQSVVFLLVLAVILAAFLIDIAYVGVDPRLRSARR